MKQSKFTLEECALLSVDRRGKLEGMSLRRHPAYRLGNIPQERQVQIGKLAVAGLGVCEICKSLNCGYRTVVRLLKRLEIPLADKRVKHGLCKGHRSGASQGQYLKLWRSKRV